MSGPAYEILVLIAYAQNPPLSAHAAVSSACSGARCNVMFVRVFIHIHALCIRASKALSSLRMLARALLAHQYDKYYVFMYWLINEPRHEISNNVFCETSKASDQPAHTRSLIRVFASRSMSY